MDKIGDFGHEVINLIIWAIEYLYIKVLIHAGTTSSWISPFNRISTILYEVYDFLVALDGHVISFRGEYDKIVDRLNAILDTTGLNTLIETLFSEWSTFRASPRDYISDKIAEMLDTWGSLKADANSWVMNRIQSADWYAWEWLRDPVGKTRQWIEDDYPLFYTLLTDTAQGVKDALAAISPEVSQFVSSPVDYLKGWFVDSLGWSWDFWVDPWRYLFSEILEAIERHIGEWRHDLTRKGERIIRFLWEGRM